MTSRSSDAAADRPPILSSAEIDELLSMTLIANLATLDQDGGIHLLPMWFLRIGNDICIPTSSHTHKYPEPPSETKCVRDDRLVAGGPGSQRNADQGSSGTRLWRGGAANKSLDPFEVSDAGRTERRQRCLLPLQRRRRNCEGPHG